MWRRSAYREKGILLSALAIVLSLIGSWSPEAEAEMLFGPAGQLERAKEFSGHVGPYLTVGLRMGERALKKLGCERYTGMVIQMECVRKAPCCFLVDGLQLSTGCTFGNRNILFISSPRIRVSFTSTRTGERVNCVLADGLRSMIEEWSKTWESDETATLLLYAVPSEFLLFKEAK